MRGQPMSPDNGPPPHGRELLAVSPFARCYSASRPELGDWRTQPGTRRRTDVGAVQFARHLAVSRGRPAVLCPGQGPACGPRNSWDTGANVAVNGTVALTLPPLPAGYRVTWNRRALGLTFRPDGSITQAGSLFVCAPDGDPRHARRIVINNQGRLYQERDRDGDGDFDGLDRREVDC